LNKWLSPPNSENQPFSLEGRNFCFQGEGIFSGTFLGAPQNDERLAWVGELAPSSCSRMMHDAWNAKLGRLALSMFCLTIPSRHQIPNRWRPAPGMAWKSLFRRWIGCKGLRTYKSFPMKTEGRDDSKGRFKDFPTGQLTLYPSLE